MIDQLTALQELHATLSEKLRVMEVNMDVATSEARTTGGDHDPLKAHYHMIKLTGRCEGMFDAILIVHAKITELEGGE